MGNELIRACLAVPPAPERGALKPLLDAAFTGCGALPGIVLARTTKGGFNALAYAGLRDNAPGRGTCWGRRRGSPRSGWSPNSPSPTRSPG
ncbi:hypothetical protein ACH4JS_12545 [Streptomyces sp. NPDC017638]|uniref:hypothetical protein n=1 Tax=Streptomyces sp. NPDC017638 TaxID=3365004 RepID=UPI0037B1E0C2